MAPNSVLLAASVDTTFFAVQQGEELLEEIPSVWPRLVRPTNLKSRMNRKKTHTHTLAAHFCISAKPCFWNCSWEREGLSTHVQRECSADPSLRRVLCHYLQFLPWEPLSVDEHKRSPARMRYSNHFCTLRSTYRTSGRRRTDVVVYWLQNSTTFKLAPPGKRGSLGLER